MLFDAQCCLWLNHPWLFADMWLWLGNDCELEQTHAHIVAGCILCISCSADMQCRIQQLYM